ncbi:hypothetical protein B481_0361 [Planococcus halocryophilus Or1]|nr:hypothetical protein B481_0361 [Planococcus halocryophilus Or1]
MEIVDADWKDKYGLAVILRRHKKTFVQLNGVEITVSFTAYKLSMIRWIDDNHFLAATYESDKKNMFIVDLSGQLLHSFNGGEAFEEIVVGKEGIWVSYFDEGVFGNGISTEGLVLFDMTGNILLRYHSDLLNPNAIADCYALCKGGGTSVWIFPYTDFPLIEINSKERMSLTYPVPELLHGAKALCIRGKYAYFFDSYNSNEKMYQLKIGTQKPLLLGTVQGVLRGLGPSETNHFISISNNQEVALYQVINGDEYQYI